MGKNPTDRGTVGTKRSVLTDGGGVPLGLAVEGAKRHDFKMARETIESIPVERLEPSPDIPQGMCLDTGYNYDEVRELLAEFGASPPTSGREGKRSRRSNRRLVSKRGGGWSSVRIVG